ncbi:MAG: AAA family ATPase [Lachnospiraceae bacterium]|nr:AAA family ATPase [Lachnospiraceae bacterium]
MAAKENQVCLAAMQFSRNIKKPIPEAVIYGYAKLLSLDENQVKNFISDDCMDDLEAAHKWFEEKRLDMDIIKFGLMIIIPLIPARESEEKQQQFKDFMDLEDKNTGSADILDKALDTSFVDFKKVFVTGKGLQDVFNYSEELKSKYPRDTQNEDESAEIPDKKESRAGDTAKKDTGAGGKVTASGSKGTGAGNRAIEKRDLGVLSSKYRKLSAELLDVVKGQDQAIEKFIQGYNQGELLKQMERGSHPKTFFFFFGPPGVGKTLLAETAANALGMPFKVFNMSEYAAHQAHEDLIGIARIYSQAKEGTLVRFVRENPECLLIFDEIEKAHLNVIRQFLQILGSGKLHNVFRDEDTSFKDATLIFTSNAGRALYEDRSQNLTSLPEKVIIDAITSEKNAYGEPAFPREMCSRIASGNTIMFNHLSIRHLAGLVRKSFDEVTYGLEQEYGVKITYTKELPLLFLFNRGGEIDARVAVSQSGKFLKDEIYGLLRQFENGKNACSDINRIDIDIEWKGMDGELKRLFKNSDHSDVMVFSDREELFDSLSDSRYKILRTDSLKEAAELARKDISAVFIDPFLGRKNDDTALSISDYNTDGVRLFHKLMETGSELPVFLLEMDSDFSETDRRTFLQAGAAGNISVNSSQPQSLKRQFNQIMEELYMERESSTFSQQGYVIDYNTKQELTDKKGRVKILFYELKKRMAPDIESRGAILSDAQRPSITFDDVIGAENAKKELKYFINYLRNPRQFLMTGVKPPRGILLYGPPGTGKTMLAKAMAGESGVTFLQSSATDFMNKYFGTSEENIRKIFERARKYAPSIIFIDEIDAIGKKRTGSDTRSAEETMLNALLTQMDGFLSSDPKKPVFLLAATNYGVDSEDDGISPLDPALIRRFDNEVYVDLPRENERKEYLLKKLEEMHIDTVSEETVQNIAERTTGQSIAILEKVFDLAKRNAKGGPGKITDDDLLSALEEILYGEKKEHEPEYYKEVAIHETGHAYVSYMNGDKPSYITIESRGSFGGYMQHSNQENVTGYTREELLAKIRISLAGRAAEEVFFGKEKSLNTGASSDLKNATELAWRIICTYGMEGDQLIVLKKEDILKSSVAPQYIEKVNGILKDEMEKTVRFIGENREKIREIADVLVKENRLTGDAFEKLIDKKQ